MQADRQEDAMWFDRARALSIPDAAEALPGRDTPMTVPARHAVLGTPMSGPWPAGTERVLVGLGCFWGAERLFWRLDGVYSTQVGYAAGHTAHPTYREVCTGRTGHNEVVQVVYTPKTIPFEVLLKTFWEGHDPTQRMRQGNDVGTQYRSGIYPTTAEQVVIARASKARYGAALAAAGRGAVATEVVEAGPFYYAEAYHQQYLHKNPNGYCGLGGTGVTCPIGAGVPGG